MDMNSIIFMRIRTSKFLIHLKNAHKFLWSKSLTVTQNVVSVVCQIANSTIDIYWL